MDKLNNALELLKKHLKNTSKKVLNEMAHKYNQVQRQGYTLDKYFSSFENEYPFLNNNTFSEKELIEETPIINEQWVVAFYSEKTEAICFEKDSILIASSEEILFSKNNNLANAA